MALPSGEKKKLYNFSHDVSVDPYLLQAFAKKFSFHFILRSNPVCVKPCVIDMDSGITVQNDARRTEVNFHYRN